MNRYLILILIAVSGSFATATAQTGPAPMQGPTTVTRTNPYGQQVISIAQELHRQYASIRWHMAYYPYDTAGLQYLSARYMQSYRMYWSYANAYHQYERQNPGRPPGQVPPGPVAGSGRIAGRVVTARTGSATPPVAPRGQVVPILRRLQISVRNAGRTVIRSEAELRNAIQNTGAPNRPAQLPRVDFRTEMVVVASMGLTGTDHRIEITEIRRSNTGMVAYFRETRPRPGGPMNSAAGYPTAAVVIQRQNLPVAFQPAAAAVAPIGANQMAVAGATIQAFRQTRNGQAQGWVNAGSARSDAQGQFQFQNLAAGSYVLRVSRQGFRNVDVRATASATANGGALTIQLAPEAPAARPNPPRPQPMRAPEVASVSAPTGGPGGPGSDTGTPAPTGATNVSLLGLSMR